MNETKQLKLNPLKVVEAVRQAQLKVMEAVRQAQDVLENHIEPGGPTCEETIHELLGIFDDHRLVMALELAHPQGRR